MITSPVVLGVARTRSELLVLYFSVDAALEEAAVAGTAVVVGTGAVVGIMAALLGVAMLTDADEVF